MNGDDILILKAHEVRSLLDGREVEVIHTIREAYETHARGDSSLPHSTFLRFPNNPKNRIIALPAYLGGEFEVAGIKWIASFPGNLDVGLDRASAVLILNSLRTGRPEAIIEGSVISAKRTAASAALAAQYLHNGKATRVGVVGCGLINFEIVRFLLNIWPEIKTLVAFDIDAARASGFKDKCQRAFGKVEVNVAQDVEAVLKGTSLISMATTAIQPHIFDLSECTPGSTILHISLRDLSPEVILSCDNIVDDVDHVCRAQTSVHLAEQLVGSRDFIRCTLADILRGKSVARRNMDNIAVFSPFGLGVLDIALGKLTCNLGIEQGLGMSVGSFLPAPSA
jgi:ornithine cyclodeaminase